MKIFLVKVFTKDKKQGNPAGVTLDTDNLTDDEMLRIAKNLGFSESAFVQKSDKADYRVRFFSPTQEVDLCGHATLATFHALVTNNLITFSNNQPVQKTQETKAGILSVTCYPDGLIMMGQQDPQFAVPETNRKRIANLLSLTEDDFLPYPIQSVSTGTAKLMIPVKSLNRLFTIKPDLEGITKYSKDRNVRGFYPFTPETLDKNFDFHARMFNPLVGIDEDPITGVAGGALACYAKHNGVSDKTSFIIEQGNVLGKSGLIMVDIKSSVQVGGYAVIFDQKEL